MTAATFAATPAFIEPQSVGLVRWVAAPAGIALAIACFFGAWRGEWFLIRRFLYDAEGISIVRSERVLTIVAVLNLLAYVALAAACGEAGHLIVEGLITLRRVV